VTNSSGQTFRLAPSSISLDNGTFMTTATVGG
jgi:hypothetical protein